MTLLLQDSRLVTTKEEKPRINHVQIKRTLLYFFKACPQGRKNLQTGLGAFAGGISWWSQGRGKKNF